ERTQVGDRFVAARMAAVGAGLGGEQSGHVILADWAVTGDGLLTALAVLCEMGRTGKPLADLAAGLATYPQVLTNVKLGQIPSGWREMPTIRHAIDAAERDLGEEGRVLVRPSGTEPLLRIMLEGRDEGQITEWADRLTAVVQEALGSATASSESAN
ncbi:MAG: phosphoglucosamine mutase, partial [Clostridia bacterium]